MLQGFIVLSCLISISVNFSTFLVIGKTSPVTYQVLGHLKTCLVLAFGYSLLRDPFSWRNILGIMVALVGMILYSYYCTQENQAKAEEASGPNQVFRAALCSLSNLVAFCLINLYTGQWLYAFHLTQNFIWLCIQRKEAESDPLLNVENGTPTLSELPLSKGTAWEVDKDLHAWRIGITLALFYTWTSCVARKCMLGSRWRWNSRLVSQHWDEFKESFL